jgi:hypothetical protein
MKRLLGIFLAVISTAALCAFSTACDGKREYPPKDEKPEVKSDYYYYMDNGERNYILLETRGFLLSLREPEIPDDILRYSVEANIPIDSDYPFTGEPSADPEDDRYYAKVVMAYLWEDALPDKEFMDLLTKFNRENPGIIVVPMYFTLSRVLMGPYFYVELKKAEDLALLEQMADEADLTIKQRRSDLPLLYELHVKENSEVNAPMLLANKFYESGLFKMARPGFYANPIDLPF